MLNNTAISTNKAAYKKGSTVNAAIKIEMIANPCGKKNSLLPEILAAENHIPAEKYKSATINLSLLRKIKLLPKTVKVVLISTVIGPKENTSPNLTLSAATANNIHNPDVI
jgi:hypothetical protein